MLESIHNSPVVNANQHPIKVTGSEPTLWNTYKTAAVKIMFKIITKVTINFENLLFIITPPFSFLMAYPLIDQQAP